MNFSVLRVEESVPHTSQKWVDHRPSYSYDFIIFQEFFDLKFTIFSMFLGTSHVLHFVTSQLTIKDNHSDLSRVAML